MIQGDGTHERRMAEMEAISKRLAEIISEEWAKLEKAVKARMDDEKIDRRMVLPMMAEFGFKLGHDASRLTGFELVSMILKQGDSDGRASAASGPGAVQG